jgi:hypothetical protein
LPTMRKLLVSWVSGLQGESGLARRHYSQDSLTHMLAGSTIYTPLATGLREHPASHRLFTDSASASCAWQPLSGILSVRVMVTVSHLGFPNLTNGSVTIHSLDAL